jgi:hypothetical protein
LAAAAPLKSKIMLCRRCAGNAKDCGMTGQRNDMNEHANRGGVARIRRSQSLSNLEIPFKIDTPPPTSRFAIFDLSLLNLDRGSSSIQKIAVASSGRG